MSDRIELRNAAGDLIAFPVRCPDGNGDDYLRLLAAEASDRLGWTWTVDPYPEFPSAEFVVGGFGMGGWQVHGGAYHWHARLRDGETPDELLAALHGKYLLDDAMRGAK